MARQKTALAAADNAIRLQWKLEFPLRVDGLGARANNRTRPTGELVEEMDFAGELDWPLVMDGCMEKRRESLQSIHCQRRKRRLLWRNKAPGLQAKLSSASETAGWIRCRH